MKKSILAAAVAATGAGMLMSGGAMAYDSVNWQGGALKEYHQTMATLPLIGTNACVSGNCTNPAFGTTIPGEALSHIIITNKTIGGPSGAYTPTADCYTYSAADYVFDASGNAIPDTGSANFTSGDMTAILRTTSNTYVPQIAAPYAAAGFQNTENLDATPTVSSICTNSEGQITGGYYGFFALGVTGINSYIVTSWDSKVAVAYQGGTAGAVSPFGNLPSFADTQTLIDTYKSGGTASIGPYPGPAAGAGDTSWDLAGFIDVAYTTCDVSTECGQFGKSVPVPAFAAAALGLGLLGITYLTGRRRAIK